METDPLFSGIPHVDLQLLEQFLTSSILFGALLGSLVGGFFTDKWGRKMVCKLPNMKPNFLPLPRRSSYRASSAR